MTLLDMSELLGNVGEFFGALLLLASLFYVAVQVRQNTQAMRATGQQALIANFYDYQQLLARDPELNDLLRRGVADFGSLSDVEKSRFGWLVVPYEGNLYNGLLLHRAGLLDRETLDQIGDSWVGFIATQGGAEWREATNPIPLVDEYVRRRLEEVGGQVRDVERDLFRSDPT